MKKLWETGSNLDAAVEAYTVGRDPELDARLLPYEIRGTLAHAAGLVRINILSKHEYSRIRAALQKLERHRGGFKIARSQEDIHTAVEQFLTKELGSLGAKIHAGRSRNDQVQVNVRLYIKDRLLELADSACAAARVWEDFAGKHQSIALAGYTHLQRAMPSTMGHWAASHAEAFLENCRALAWAYDEADASPLGSAAGFGAGLPLDRGYVARLLGFSRVQRNTLRVQSSRPRLEAAVVSALSLTARDMGVLAWDISLYSSAEFGFLKLDAAFTTGSSLMPQKKNPDVAELTRARAALFPGRLSQILSVGLMPSGYHRDYQLTKAVLFEALDATAEMFDICGRLSGSLKVNRERCAESISSDMMATEKVLSLVKKGVPFREAYRQIADLARSPQTASRRASLNGLPSYSGAPGKPDLNSIAADRGRWQKWVSTRRASLHDAWDRLLSGPSAR